MVKLHFTSEVGSEAGNEVKLETGLDIDRNQLQMKNWSLIDQNFTDNQPNNS